MTNRVCVLGADLQVLAPCTAKRARRLCASGNAKKYRSRPYTIILKHVVENPTPCPLELRFDPGSKVTGIAVVATHKRGDVAIWAAELHHRGHQIKSDLEKRSAARR
ncbi:MAG: RRXRR domain-containing protein, partial [Gammaproteobacteria bacterium]